LHTNTNMTCMYSNSGYTPSLFLSNGDRSISYAYKPVYQRRESYLCLRCQKRRDPVGHGTRIVENPVVKREEGIIILKEMASLKVP
jgi:hypothetical protein